MPYTVNKKITDILKRHPDGGETFFNALDLMLRSDKSILDDYVTWVTDLCEENMSVGCILTGSFGRVLLSMYHKMLYANFGQVIIVNGGIRSGVPVELPVLNVPMKRYVLLDDSYYSGKTRGGIEKALQVINPETRIDRTFVIYDGSHNWEDGIYAMYRYYNEKEMPSWNKDE